MRDRHIAGDHYHEMAAHWERGMGWHHEWHELKVVQDAACSRLARALVHLTTRIPSGLAALTLCPCLRNGDASCLQEVVSQSRSSSNPESRSGASGSGVLQDSTVQQEEQQALGGKGRHVNSWVSHSDNVY